MYASSLDKRIYAELRGEVDPMRADVKLMIPLNFAVACAVIFLPANAAAQAVSLQEQLAAQYKVVKMGSDTSGYSVVEPGTLLAIQKGGVLGVPYSDKTALTTKYENGTVHSPNGLMVASKRSLLGHFSATSSQGQTTHLFQKGEKVYPSKIEVNLEKDTVELGVVACDKCNNTDPPTYNKAQILFQFPKGTLAKASAGDVEDTIGQLLAISDDSQQGGGDQNAQQQQGQQGGQGQQQDQQAADQGQQPQQQAEPQTIEKGQTPDQVEAALGKPDKIVNLGAKQLYIYKDLKVTFLNGKVSDVE
jgi:hypothetical protein